MEEAIQCDVPAKYASNSGVPVVLRTDPTLGEDDLSEEAKAQFSYHTEIFRAFQLNAHSILADDRLSPIGRHLFCMTLEKDHTNCKRVLNYVAAHPELKTTEQSMPPPLILCGLPRTGSTLLFNLLACDPACRAPLLTDMTHPVPPLARSDTARQTQRNIVADEYSEMLNTLGLTNYEREIYASHPQFAYEEDKFIFFHAGVSWLPYRLVPRDNTEVVSWFLNDTNKDFVYEYHKIFMHMLNSIDAPRSHWLLKNPLHGLYLDTLVRHYPSASLIMTHRRLDDVLPSFLRLSIAYMSVYFDTKMADTTINTNTVMERSLRVVDVAIHKLVKFRRANQRTPLFDVFYDDLLAQPIDTVRRIYEHFGLAWSNDFELAMLAWLHDNPQGKQGRNAYALEEFGLKREVIEQRYEEYNSMFFPNGYD